MGLLEVLGLNVCFVFHTYLFLGSFGRFPSIRATETGGHYKQLCHQAIFVGEGDVVLFENTMRHDCSINLPKNKCLSSEMNGERVGEIHFAMLNEYAITLLCKPKLQIVFEISSCKIEEVPTSRKFDLLLRNWIKY